MSDAPAPRAADLLRDPNPLAHCYRDFRVGERLLLTGHSHQAWPDRARRGLERAWADAAELADGKWERAFAAAERVRAGFTGLLGDRDGALALGASTHELLVRLLSALPWRHRRRVVTTDAEFHSARRQLQRLEEEGVEVVRVAARPAADVGERLAAAVDDRTACVLVSTVFFTSGEIAGGLEAAAAACRRHGAALVLDAYHQLAVVPFRLGSSFADAFVLGGGYKYCQLGEGNCFLRLPPGCRLRPVVTGWFAEFGELEEAPVHAVAYAPGAERFAGATYDPVSHYRGAEVFDFFRDQGLRPELLREVSQAQVGRLAAGFDALDLPPAVLARDRAVPLAGLAGFLALHGPRAGEIAAECRRRGLACDSRGATLRLGPAPYLSPAQLDEAVALLGEAARAVAPPI